MAWCRNLHLLRHHAQLCFVTDDLQTVEVVLNTAHGKPLVEDAARLHGLLLGVAEHAHDVVVAAMVTIDVAHSFSHHAKLLEIDEAVDAIIVAEVDEGQVLGNYREEGYDRCGDAVHQRAVYTHVLGRVHEGLHLLDELLT